VAELAPSPQPVTSDTSDDEITHVVCAECDPRTALCGTDTGDSDWDENAVDDCVVCADLEDYYDRIGTCCRIGAEHDRG
jgi:hypothetical protein